MQSSPSEMAQTSISTTFPTKTSNHKTIGIVTRPILRRHSHHLCLFSMECSGTTRNTQPTPFSFHSSKTTLTTYILLSLFSPRVDWLKCVMVMLHVLFYLRHRLTNDISINDAHYTNTINLQTTTQDRQSRRSRHPLPHPGKLTRTTANYGIQKTIQSK